MEKFGYSIGVLPNRINDRMTLQLSADYFIWGKEL